MNKQEQPGVMTLPNGYRQASYQGATLIVRPDGSQSWSNVQGDSGLYGVLCAALFQRVAA